MNNRLRFVPPKQRLEMTSGVWRNATCSPFGAWTRTPLVSTPPQPQPHQTLPSVSQRMPSVNPGLKSANSLPPLTPVPLFTTSNTMILAGNCGPSVAPVSTTRSEEHTSELQSHSDLVCRLLLEKKKKNTTHMRELRPDKHDSAPRT